MNPDELTAEQVEVQRLFNQWQSYKNVVDQNYMHHREAYGALHERLRRRTQPFSFLELACGDASCTVPALAETAVGDYTGVDFARAALRLAQDTIRHLRCPARLIEQDFNDYITESKRKWDVIFIGLSYHHLTHPEKEAFARIIHAHLNPGGTWIFFEPVKRPDETREVYTERWWQHIGSHWEACTPEELEGFHAHVRQYDYRKPSPISGPSLRRRGSSRWRCCMGIRRLFMR